MTLIAPELSESKDQELDDSKIKWEEWKKLITENGSSDQKLRQCIDFMMESLSQPKLPNFKSFWEARKICIDLFKDSSLSSVLRGQMWAEFIELTQQARQLKKIFEEQSAFAVEQIGSAIDALENEIALFEETINKTFQVTFASNPRSIQGHVSYYGENQRKIFLYNALAAKINGLRKELMNTEMRIRSRNQFFQRLSKAGDLVFPVRKNCIQEISAKFSEDVKTFMKKHPLHVDANQSLHFIREEIKALQGFAKEIYLNTPTFSETREALSKYWDKMRSIEKERKKKYAENKQLYKENFEEVKRQIEEFKSLYEKVTPSSAQMNHQMSGLHRLIQTKELGIQDKKALKEEIAKAKDFLCEKIRKEESIQEQQEKEKEQKNQAYLASLKTEVEEFEASVEKYSAHELREKYQQLQQKLVANDHETLRARLTSFQDVILERSHREIVDGSKGTAEELSVLYAIRQEKMQLLEQITEQHEKYRKCAVSSGLNFEKAIYYQEQIAKEKERLDTAEEALEDVEKRIQELKTRC